jgi:DNA-binding IclR family transcriptional regulator
MSSLNLIEKKAEGYVLGIRLFELGNKVPVKQLIVEKIHPLLVKLVEDVNETVNLGELNSNQLLYLDKVESRHSLQIQTYIGSYTSLHSTALGKASLSILKGKERENTIAKIIFDKRTKSTITDPIKFKTHIEIVDKKGYSLDNEELEVGLNCVAVPLAIPEFNFCGAISFSGPSVRFTKSRMTELAEKLKETVSEINEELKLGA